MALPPVIQTVTVNFGPMLDFQGQPLRGSTTFEPSTPIMAVATGTPILNRPITVEWDVDGMGSVILPASDSVGINVSGFTYRVTHRTFDSGAPAPTGGSIVLPAAAPSVDLDVLVPTTAANGVVIDQPAVVSVAGMAGAITAQQVADAIGGALVASPAAKAAFGPTVTESRIAATLAQTNRVGQPRPAMPAVRWVDAPTAGMDKVNLLTFSGGAVVLDTVAPWARLVNVTPANALIDQNYWAIGNGSNGSGTPGPLTLETQVTTDRLIAQLNPIAGGGTLAQPGNVEVWIDDVPLFIPTGPANGAHSPAYLELAWPSKGTHTIRIGLVLVSPGDTYVSAGDPIAATAAGAGPRLLVLGDSWTEGTAFAPISFARLLPRYLGIDDGAVCGQGGTGYTANGGGGGKSVYGSTNRLDALVANSPTDVVVFGTINDTAATPSTITTAAGALYAALASRLPAARVFVVLPQPAGATDAASAAHISNREAVRAAATAAPNVVAVVDPSDWLTGTGWSTVRQGDGNRDLYLGQDNVHPTQAGSHYFAQRLAEVLQRWLYV